MGGAVGAVGAAPAPLGSAGLLFASGLSGERAHQALVASLIPVASVCDRATVISSPEARLRARPVRCNVARADVRRCVVGEPAEVMFDAGERVGSRLSWARITATSLANIVELSGRALQVR